MDRLPGAAGAAGQLHPLVLLWFRLRVKVHQHDHEQEKHHNGTCINDQVHNGNELRVKQDVVPRDSEENSYQPKYTVNRVLAEYHHQRTEDGHCSQEPKQDFRNTH